jgi:LIM domain kinase 1
MGIGKEIRSNEEKPTMGFSSDEESDEELVEAISNLKHVGVHANGRGESQQPLINGGSDYSTSVVREAHSSIAPALSSILTIRPSPTPEAPSAQIGNGGGGGHVRAQASDVGTIGTIDTYATASSQIAPSIAAATEGGSTIRMSPSTLMHRFTLIKPGATKRGSMSGSTSPTAAATQQAQAIAGAADGWSPFDFFFSSGMLAAKCDLCAKRIGWKPVLECDDCGLRAHIKCGETAPRDCGLRPARGRAASPSENAVKGRNQRKVSK